MDTDPRPVLERRADLSPVELAELRALLERAFEGDFTDDDWAHAQGGLHVLLRVRGALVACAALVPRTLHVDGRPLEVGYVEAVAVAAPHRRRGHGHRVVAEVEDALRSGPGTGFLSASQAGAALYASRGWRPWRGPTHVRTPAGGTVRTPDDDGGVHVLDPAGTLDLDASLACDWRPGDVW